MKKTLALIAVLALLLLGLMLSHSYSARLGEQYSALEASGLTGDALEQARERACGKLLGPLTLLPALIAVALAFITKEVVISLFAGLISGLILIAGSSGVKGFSGLSQLARSVTLSFIDKASLRFNCTIILLCITIGGLVAVINRAGGFSSLAKKLTRNISNRRAAGFIGELLGVLVFFDDYANSLIVGPVMRPITDRLGVSREKLAYIVDSTAAPVSGIAIISSWIAAELSAMKQGFAVAGIERSAYGTFLGSIPFCFYCIFCLVIVLSNTVTGRDFGPMLAAERRAKNGHPLKPGSTPESRSDFSETAAAPEKHCSVLIAILPILFLCGFALTSFYIEGKSAAIASGALAADAPFSLSSVSIAFGCADTVTILLEAAVLATFLALLLGWLFGCFDFAKGVSCWLSGASSLLMTAVILVLAWALSDAITSLGTAYYLVDMLTVSLPYWLLPTLIFCVCCVVSFAAGSWGCLLIAMPMVIPAAVQMISAHSISYADPFLFACVASTLSGSIFGDHCSPVTDTTILSSVGAGCANMDHVRTQLPYALSGAAIAVLFGTLPAGLGVSPWILLPAGMAACFGLFFLFGKKP